MAAVGLAATLAQARTVIAALTPNTGSHGFVLAAANIPAGRTPPIRERVFDVVADNEPPELADMSAPDAADFFGRFTVSVRYALKNDPDAAKARASEDAEQIIFALWKSSNYAAGTQLVESTGGSQEETDGFLLRKLTFRARFRRIF